MIRIAFTAFCTLASALLSSEAAAETAPRPNIVVIFADDLGYGDLGSYGLKTARTPHLDRLAADGTRFTSFYSQEVCGPARAALLTGRYPSRSDGGWNMPPKEITIAHVLKEVGYATCCIGKWDVSGRQEIIDRMPLARGFDFYYGPLGANDIGKVFLWEGNKSIGADADLASLSRRYTDKAIDWMKEQVSTKGVEKRKPFFLYLPHTMMHTVIDASPEFRDRTGNGLYADTLEELDHECGRLLQAIDDLGIRDDTLVIFTSDNGPWSNDAEDQHAKQEGRAIHKGKNPNPDHPVAWSKGPEIAWGDSGPLREAKRSSYEGGVRVPCIARWPGKVPAGAESTAIFATLDFLPTFAALAGGSVPADRVIDGVDQTNLLLGTQPTGNRNTYFYQSGKHGVREGRWKFLRAKRWAGQAPMRYPKDQGSDGEELYDLEADLGETTNLAEQHPDVVERLRSLQP